MSPLVDRRMSYRFHDATGECRLRLYEHSGRFVAILTDVTGLSTTNGYEDAASQVYRTFRHLYPMRPQDLLVIAHRLPGEHDIPKREHFTYHDLTWDEGDNAFDLKGDRWHHPTHDDVVALCGQAIA